jgi:hypothetical protein
MKKEINLFFTQGIPIDSAALSSSLIASKLLPKRESIIRINTKVKIIRIG